MSFIHISTELSTIYISRMRVNLIIEPYSISAPQGIHLTYYHPPARILKDMTKFLLQCGYRESNPNLVLGKDAFCH